MRISPLLFGLIVSLVLSATSGCLEAGTDSGQDVVYVNDGPPIDIDAGNLDADPNSADTLPDPADWEGPDTGSEDNTNHDTGPRFDGDNQIEIGPEDRPATVLLPDNYDGQRKFPVVFLFHGYTTTSASQDAYFALSERRHDREFIIVLADGTVDSTGQQFWNATDYCCDFYGAAPDDVGYFETLLDDVIAETTADPERVHLVGYSAGAFLNYRLACEHGSRIASISGLAGSGHASPSTCDEPDGQVSVLHIHGSHDAVIYYNGVWLTYPGAPTMTNRWSDRNDCSGQSSIYDYISLDALIVGTETSRRSYDDCPDDIGVEFWTILGGSHVPGLTSSFAEHVLDFALPRTNPDTP